MGNRFIRAAGLLAALLVCWASPALGIDKLQGYAERGGSSVTTAGMVSATKVQRSFPGATVQVYLAGTLTPATIYSDAVLTAKANPFTADANAYWFFYAADGDYDVKFSGGGITTPFTLSGLRMSSVSVATTLPYTHVKDSPYNAKCDGVTNDTAAVQAAAAAMNALGGGIVQFPDGTCICASALNMTGYSGVWLRGVRQANSSIANSSVLQFTGAGAAAGGIIGQSSQGVRISNLYVYNSNPAFTGVLVNMDGTTLAPTSDFMTEDCNFGDVAAASSALLSLNKNILFGVSHINFLGGVVQISGVQAGGFSNGGFIDGECQFGGYTTAAIKNPATSWKIDSNVFEPGAGGIQKAVQITVLNSWTGSFTNNWLGDSTASFQALIEISGVGVFSGGNYISAFSGAGNTAYKMVGLLLGCHFAGDHIEANPQVAFDFFGTVTEPHGTTIENNAIDSNTPITSITRVGTTATVTTTAAHGRSTGNVVEVLGANEEEYNGRYPIVVTGASIFTYTFGGSATSPATGAMKLSPFINFSTAAPTRRATIRNNSRTSTVESLPEWTHFTPVMTASAGTWTGGTINTAKFRREEQEMVVVFDILSSSVSAPAALLQLQIPDGAQSAFRVFEPMTADNNGTPVNGTKLVTGGGGTVIYLSPAAFNTGTWAAAASTTSVSFTFTFPVQ